MEDKFKEVNYCAVFLGDTDGVRGEIESISVGSHIGWAESKNVTISTFICQYQPEDLTEYFTHEIGLEVNRNFFIMKVNDAAIYLNNQMIHEKLFEVFDIQGEPEEDFDVEVMGEEERNNIIDDLLDKGGDLTEYDKKLLDLLIKRR